MDYSDLCLVDEFDFLDDINCVLDADLLAYSSEELLLGSSTTEACKLSKSDFFSPKTCQPVVQQLLTTAQADGTSTSQHASFQALLDGERFQNVQGASAVGPSAPQSDWPSGEVPTSGPSSNNLETTSKQSFQQVIDKPQTAVRPAPSRSTECSRKAQRHYREKQKARMQQLQDELAASKAIIAKLQAESRPSHTQSLVPVSAAYPNSLTKPQIKCIAWQAPDMPAPNVMEVLHTPWTSWGALLTCDLNPRQAEACQYIAALSLPELAAMRKGYVKRLSKILLVTGQDTDGPLGAQLGQLEHELCCLHAVKTRVAPREWSRFFYFKGPQDQSLEGWDGPLSEANCVALLHMLQLTDTQKATLCALRRAYITRVTGVAKQRQRLLQQLQHMPSVKLDHSDLEATCDEEEAIMHKLQNCVIQENYWYLDLLGHVGHEVFTLWQGCVAICHAFPKSPDVLAIVNAVAREAGEPSTHALSSAVGQTVDEGQWFPGSSYHADMPTTTCAATMLCHSTFGLITSEVTPQHIFG